jgi:hypothetical protein
LAHWTSASSGLKKTAALAEANAPGAGLVPMYHRVDALIFKIPELLADRDLRA